VIEGDLLPERVLLTNWDENLVLTRRSGAYQQPGEQRPHLDVLEYWLIAVPHDLSPWMELGNPQARYPFYPATADSPAVLGGYVVEQSALDVLERHGVPTRVDWSPRVGSNGLVSKVLPAVAAAGIFLMLAVIVAVRRLRSRAQATGPI
jgi:hypothetical protein